MGYKLQPIRSIHKLTPCVTVLMFIMGSFQELLGPLRRWDWSGASPSSHDENICKIMSGDAQFSRQVIPSVGNFWLFLQPGTLD